VIALAIETTTDRLSVAAVRQCGSSAVRQVEGARKHAALLLPLIGEVLQELELRLEEVEGLALADGPGSFTGLRVGAAAAKALARAQPRLAVWTASTLLVRAAGAAPLHGARVLVVTPALRGELYAACYRMNLPTAIETLAAPALATPESLHRETPDLLVADVPEKLVDRLADQFAVPLVRGDPSRPHAAALLTLLGVAGGAQRVGELDNWEPCYGRPAEAQARWEALHGRPLSNPFGVTC
jgi:tRNA threonylcarbamoyladenosine biosynthesis protein TsaB